MWTFIQDQVLGMKWLSALIGNLLMAFGFDITGKIESCSHIWQKIFVLQNLEKRFRFLCLNYTTKQT